MRTGMWVCIILLTGSVVGIVALLTHPPSIGAYDHEIILNNVGGEAIEYSLFHNGDLLANGILAANSQFSYTLNCKTGDSTLTLFADGVRYEKVYGGGGVGGLPAMPEIIYFVIGG